MISVDPRGDDSGPGTRERPFATLERGRDAAEPGTVVELRAGTYRLGRTFRLSAEHSGVVYQARGYGTPHQEEVVVSGGRPVTGWRVEADGVHLTEVAGPAPRQLYVSGRRAERARIPLEQAMSRTSDGYTVEGSGPQSWRGDVEFVYRGAYPWSEARCPVARISGDAGSTAITMAQPAFERAARLYHAVITWEGPGAGESRGADSPAFAENSPAFLTSGTFATDGTTLHYRPRPGEEPRDVVAPILETLLHARGVRDVAFRGITFADAAWPRPSGPEGFLHYHGNGYYDGGELLTVTFAGGQGQVTVPAATASIPGNLVFEEAHRVVLEGCRFTRLGAVALEFRGAGSGNVLRRSEICEVAGGGLVIGAGARDHRVEDNRIHHVGRDYRGSPGVAVSGTDRTVVAHNEVHDTPHAGIVVYEGRRTQVLNNLVHDTMQVLADGGGIYLAGPQGDSHASGALVRGNVVRDTLTPYNFGLYTDYGASWVTVQGNAVHRCDAPVALDVSPPLEHAVFVGNVFDADPGGPPDGVVLADNRTLPDAAFGDDPVAADIAAGAGPRPAPGR
ncbi:right-handed parallel beta-helix repeat-containing protein [Marinitenerispora sediminis]|uniref:Right-handed parallel beta-helix repeat-containing protein n=1 Tax=Marinitenerispora sediminis TaxID=1931232 RepID=A0A368TAH1_9ACTN|nr:right-handed parallel beta-helix repeat-containing protein [Marinitenerispora sediminis]RCV50920.1 right-handed parallel beta-helix repeat-containing protein [Marinitenerispora sediminis]RCV59720.1 right-handed parallel beta-helix repeat-containing protein [Marinitenerispora sediminis]RCV59828.1 right-handed parallel beta-helix repeat-containing protein [Marinitenerispora sediminis]